VPSRYLIGNPSKQVNARLEKSGFLSFNTKESTLLSARAYSAYLQSSHVAGPLAVLFAKFKKTGLVPSDAALGHVVHVLGREKLAIGVSTAYSYEEWGAPGREVRAGLARAYKGDLGAWRIAGTLVGSAGSGRMEVGLKSELRGFCVGKHVDYVRDTMRVAGVRGGLRWVLDDGAGGKEFWGEFCREDAACVEVGVQWAVGKEAILKGVADAGVSRIAVLNGIKAAGEDGALVREIWEGRKEVGNDVWEYAHGVAERMGDAAWRDEILQEWVVMGGVPRACDVGMQGALEASGRGSC
jgi:hypothetical protein